MKEVLLKWIEYRKHKFDLTHCQHSFVEKDRDRITETNRFNGSKNQYNLVLYECKKCGEFRRVSTMDDI